MTDSFIGLPPDSSGKKLRTTSRVVGGEAVHEQHVVDDFRSGEVLPEQIGLNDVLTFTFSSPVNLVVVESSGANLVSRADPFGGTPSASQGIPCRDLVPVYLPVVTSVVRVFAVAGTVVNVHGFRRGA